VEKMSGKIWIKSKTGEGTTFFLSLRKGKFEHMARNRV
jgi:signal transduction histidine kinase